jgi:hypothetical protein
MSRSVRYRTNPTLYELGFETGGHIRKQSRGIYKIVDPLLSMSLLGD